MPSRHQAAPLNPHSGRLISRELPQRCGVQPKPSPEQGPAIRTVPNHRAHPAAVLTAGLLFASALVALAGCSSILPTQPTTSTSKIVSPMASAPAQAVAPIVVQTQIGDAVSSQAAINDGLLAYPMIDGSHIAVSADQPLPFTVAADVSARLKRIVDAYPLRYGTRNPTTVLSQFGQQLGRMTGKQVMVIAPVFIAVNGQKPTVIWSVIDNKNFYSKTLAVACAERITGIQPDPQLWLTVISG